jgi:hypothetical protein
MSKIGLATCDSSPRRIHERATAICCFSPGKPGFKRM